MNKSRNERKILESIAAKSGLKMVAEAKTFGGAKGKPIAGPAGKIAKPGAGAKTTKPHIKYKTIVDWNDPDFYEPMDCASDIMNYVYNNKEFQAALKAVNAIAWKLYAQAITEGQDVFGEDFDDGEVSEFIGDQANEAMRSGDGSVIDAIFGQN